MKRRLKFLPTAGLSAFLAMMVVMIVPGIVFAEDELSGADQLRVLNEGYSMLYASASGLSNVDKAFLIKFESDATESVVTDASNYMGELAANLEQLATDYPSLRLDLQPLPAIERKKQSAATAARIKSFAPIVGRTGPNFERTLLLTLSGGLNQLRHLARVMAAEEREQNRQKLLENAEQRMDGLYNRMVKLLNDEYYIHNTYEPGE